MKLWPFSKKTAPPIEAKSLADPSAELLALFGASPAYSGVPVTAQSAMKCTAVRRAVEVIAEPIGQLPIHVYARDGETKERDPDHPVAKLLRDPNPWQAGSDLREQLQRDSLLHGDGLAAIVRGGGKPKELIRYKPGSVTITADDYGAPVYKHGNTTLRREDVFHIKAPSLDGVKGEAVITSAKEAIGLAIVLERHAATFFQQASRPGGIIEIPAGIGDTALIKMRAAWKAAYEGWSNSGSTPVLWEGAQFKPLAFSSVDSEFLAMRRFAVEEIARAFSVPPHLLFEMGRATWGNSSEMGASFVTFTLMRWIKAWQSEIRLKLFDEAERETHFAEFLTEDLLKADISARADSYTKLRAAGILSINECRARESLPPIGPEGDRHDNPNTSTASPAANDNTPSKEAASG